MELKCFEIGLGNEKNEVLNGDANEIITEVSGDILYLDTPTTLASISNYHVLESIARYDYPEVRGHNSAVAPVTLVTAAKYKFILYIDL